MISVGFKSPKADKAEEWKTTWSKYPDVDGFVINENKKQIALHTKEGTIKRVLDYSIVRTIFVGDCERGDLVG
jgi:hypothetical protein